MATVVLCYCVSKLIANSVLGGSRAPSAQANNGILLLVEGKRTGNIGMSPLTEERRTSNNEMLLLAEGNIQFKNIPPG